MSVSGFVFPDAGLVIEVQPDVGFRLDVPGAFEEFTERDGSWSRAVSCVLPGLWAVLVPWRSQWLRLIVDGELHVWFRPVRPRHHNN